MHFEKRFILKIALLGYRMFKIRLCLCLVLVWFWPRGHKSKTITLLLCLTLSLYIPFLKVRLKSKVTSSNFYGPGARRPWTLCQSWEFGYNMYVSKIRNAFLWCMLIMIIEHWFQLIVGSATTDGMIKLLLINPNLCGGVLACFLDNTVRGMVIFATSLSL